MTERTKIPVAPRPADDAERMALVRRLAKWELGYSSWADRFIAAYFAPEPTREILDRDGA